MFGALKDRFSLRKLATNIGVAAAVLAVGAPAMAFPDPEMGAITLPITGASIVTAIVALGASVLLLYFGPTVGVSFVKTLVRRLKNAF